MADFNLEYGLSSRPNLSSIEEKVCLHQPDYLRYDPINNFDPRAEHMHLPHPISLKIILLRMYCTTFSLALVAFLGWGPLWTLQKAIQHNTFLIPEVVPSHETENDSNDIRTSDFQRLICAKRDIYDRVFFSCIFVIFISYYVRKLHDFLIERVPFWVYRKRLSKLTRVGQIQWIEDDVRMHEGTTAGRAWYWTSCLVAHLITGLWVGGFAILCVTAATQHCEGFAQVYGYQW